MTLVLNALAALSAPSARYNPSPFRYHVGITSLAQIATREDRVCVLNILGGESREVTPVGHVYSGGNVVFGTSPGRRGQVLDTRLGPIPVYNNVREGLEDGHRFNCGVVYLPPSAARDGVAELVRVNPEVRKIFIVTEKLSVHDQREIRAMGQAKGVDIFGANSLGVADAWNQVRIGGALGGDAPGEALQPGSIAILSNSGNFTTTIATYLRMAGWGTTTLISSGKDVYIQYAAPEFAFALANDARSKAAVLYVEPGGYYELEATFTKPVVACVVGRWKSRLTRAVGHAGALAGGDDDARAKEHWLMAKIGVDQIFSPERPVFSERGAVVTNIAHIPAALTAVMGASGVRPDFPAESSLALKPWFASNAGVALPRELDLAPVEAIPPYNAQIHQLHQSVGVVFPRRSMKDASGASQMDPVTQISSLHGVNVLDAAELPLESSLALALLRERGGDNDRKLVSLAVGGFVNLYGEPALAAAQAAREAGNAPNTVLATACGLIGPRHAERAGRAAAILMDRFARAGVHSAVDESQDLSNIKLDASERSLLVADAPDPRAEALLQACVAREARSVFVRYLTTLGGHPTEAGVLAAITTTLAWGPLLRKRISRHTAVHLPWWMRLFGTLIGASANADQHEPDRFRGVPMQDVLERSTLTELAYLALFGCADGRSEHLFAFQTLVSLLLTNGPGSISAQGAKGAVSADGPETPERVQLNKALVGFLTHTGYAHGGNGNEGIAFLLERFRATGLRDPSDPQHGLDLHALAASYAAEYGHYKADSRSSGSGTLHKIPGINHPVFKDRPVNFDPREVFIRELFTRRGEYNVFHEYYRALVQALYDAGVARNVYAVNVDAVIAALLLKMLWRPYTDGAITEGDLESAAFSLFLYGRMLGCAAEIEDHLNRGRDMDTRTPASRCEFVA